MARSTPPAGLGNAGRALWRQMHDALGDEFEYDERELALLAQACRQRDDIAALETARKKAPAMVTGSTGQPVLHPALAELRMARLALARMLGELRMPADTGKAATFASKRAAHAANVRHGNFGAAAADA